MERLERQGVVPIADEDAGKSQWMLTELGVREVVPLQIMCAPRSALQSRPGVALARATSYELLLMLEAAGWSWCHREPKQRPLPYAFPDGELVFYTPGLNLLHGYARCLLLARDLHASGITKQIEHCEPVTYYRKLLEKHENVGRSRNSKRLVCWSPTQTPGRAHRRP